MRAASLSAVVVALSAPSLFAQTLEFRIVERTGQTVADPADGVLDFAVQARFGGTQRLGGFNFDIRMPGEAESRGTLARGGISNTDGTYDPGLSTGATVGRVGLARQYSHLAGITPNFNGVINQSAGTFTNTPDQEIGLVTAFAEAGPLLGVPGVDTDGDGNPDTWSGNGSGNPPQSLAVAALNPTVAGPYFAGNQYIDVYRFRYTITDFTARTLQIRLDALSAQQFTQLVFSGGIWGAQNTNVASTAIINNSYSIPIVPAPAAAVPLAMAGLLCGARRRRG